ncbi:MAG TPA: ThuA domain-containing protein [Candidatus Limnocylindria bacterium]|jgi:hypothetical protein|nr:ThuA domain-containing protein [Candidatus Limnocylindria bacterium]
MKQFFRVATLAAVAVVSVVLQAEDKHIVLIAGPKSHPPGMHEFRAGCLLFQKCLAEVPGIKVDVYSNGWPTKVEGDKTVDDNSVFGQAAAVLIYADGGPGHPALKPGRIEILDKVAARGAGLGFAHYGVEIPVGPGGDALKRWVGGHYENLYSVNPMWSPNYRTFPEHPITHGVKPFTNRDEWYFNMRWGSEIKQVTPILTDTPSDEVRKGPYVYPAGPYPHIIAASGHQETMMWAFERTDGGRGFGFTGGHTHKNWGDPNQRKVMLNALLWLAKVEVPANGIESVVTAEDLGQNLDLKK